MPRISHNEVQARDAQVIAGIQKDLSTASSLALAGSTYTPASLTQLVQSRIDAVASVTAARAAWLATVAKYRALDPQVTQVVRSLRNYVIDVHGASSPVLADFGFTPPKKTALTAGEIVARTAKSNATRKARHTMGSQQKKTVTGNVTGVVVTPVTEPSPSPDPASPTPAPASPAPVSTPHA